MPHACMKGRSDMGLSIGRTPSIEMKRSGIETALRINWITETFRWRCAQGTHPYPSRTRWLRPGRPMVLCWRRHGRAGGCRRTWGISSVGRAPALQAGGHEFDSRILHSAISRKMYIENCTQKVIFLNEQCRPQRLRALGACPQMRKEPMRDIVRMHRSRRSGADSRWHCG